MRFELQSIDRRIARVAEYAEQVRRRPPTLREVYAAADMVPDDWQLAMDGDEQQAMFLAARQAGKSLGAAAMASKTVAARPDELVLCISPAERQSIELIRTCKHMLGSLGVPLLGDASTKLETVLHSRIIALPSSERTIRGYARPGLIIIDEAARVEDDVMVALLPMLATRDDYRLIAISSAKYRTGWFYEQFTAESSLWARTVINFEQISRYNDDVIELMRQNMTAEEFRAEMLCEFEDPEGAFMSDDEFSAAVIGCEFVPELGAVA